MTIILYIISKFVQITLFGILGAMVCRSLLSLFVVPEESILYIFLAYVTEPVILPFRILLERLNIGQELPIDLSMLVAYASLSMIIGFLPVI